MGPPDDTSTRSLPTPSPNLSGKDVDSALACVGTTTSVLSTTPLYIMVYPLESPRKYQSSPPQSMLCGMYPPPLTFTLTLSGCVPSSSFGMTDGGDTLLNQLALPTQPKFTVAYVPG